MVNHKSDPILEIDALCSSYENEQVLKDVSFTLNRGDVLCLLGSSGSGKTTLLRVLAGLEEKESGRLLFNGQDISRVAPHKRRIGMMFQEYALFPHKTVRENIAFGLQMQKTEAHQQEQKIEQMLDLVGLTGFGDRTIDQLSGGERQRVALARSLAPEPLLLLLDEPLGSLDRTLRDRLAVEIRAILKQLDVTAIFVTHDQAEAFSVADKVAVLHQGELLQLDNPEELYRYPVSKRVARFLGFTNLIDGLVDSQGNFQSFTRGLDEIQPLFSSPEHTGQATLLIRPDGAQIADGCSNGMQLRGIVAACRFLGGSYSLTLKIEETLLSFSLPIDPVVPEVGSEVTVALNPASVVLLAPDISRHVE